MTLVILDILIIHVTYLHAYQTLLLHIQKRQCIEDELVQLKTFKLKLLLGNQTTKLDFGNATLAGIQSFQLNRLQAVMNAAARLVFQSSRREHITPLLY